MTLDLAAIIEARREVARTYKPLYKYPSLIQDMSLKIARDVRYDDVFRCVRDALLPGDSQVVGDIWPISIYSPSADVDHKTITLRIKITHPNHTLSDSDVSAMLDRACQEAHEAYGAERV